MLYSLHSAYVGGTTNTTFLSSYHLPSIIQKPMSHIRYIRYELFHVRNTGLSAYMTVHRALNSTLEHSPCAVIPSLQPPPLYDLLALLQIIEGEKSRGINKVLSCSALEVYNDPCIPYHMLYSTWSTPHHIYPNLSKFSRTISKISKIFRGCDFSEIGQILFSNWTRTIWANGSSFLFFSSSLLHFFSLSFDPVPFFFFDQQLCVQNYYRIFHSAIPAAIPSRCTKYIRTFVHIAKAQPKTHKLSDRQNPRPLD